VTAPKASEAAISKAANLILAGELVAVPTETVYGLAGDATNGEAVALIFVAKGRPHFNPLIVHVASLAEAERHAAFDAAARALAEAHWPGPLTLVLERRADSPITKLASAGLRTIALRVPAHPVMQALIAACGRPLAAPSANRSGRLSPTRAAHVRASFGDEAPFVIDAGPTEHGLESTIIVSHEGRLRLLRPGPIVVPDAEPAEAGGAIEAPGQLAVHYAPSKPLRLGASERREGEWLIGFGAIPGDATLSARGDLIEAAANLFERLHEADASSHARIAVAPVPDAGIGAAINDRLGRASRG